MAVLRLIAAFIMVTAGVSAQSRYDWSQYDPSATLTLTGIVRGQECRGGRIRNKEQCVGGYVTITLKADTGRTWVVILGAPEDLKRAGGIELKLGIPVVAVVRPLKAPNAEARAMRVSFDHGPFLNLSDTK